MVKKTVVLIVGCLTLLAGGSTLVWSLNAAPQITISEVDVNSNKKSPSTIDKKVPLTFMPSMKEPLQRNGPQKEQMSLAKIQFFKKEDGLASSTVHLYTHKKNQDWVYAYLKDKDNWYEVGMISNQGLDLTAVKTTHLAGEEQVGIQIAGTYGKDDERLRLIRFNPKTEIWEQVDFQGHSSKSMDLEGDGEEVLVSYLVDDFMEVHRWNKQEKRFETATVHADVIQMYETDNLPIYTFLFQEAGYWIIECGIPEQTPHFFRYEDGYLVELELADTRSRRI